MAQILVVDDSEVIRTQLENYLTEQGYDIVTAIDGLDGLNKLRTDPFIQLIITDINMPNMDGLTMAKQIRYEMGNDLVKILALTTETTMEMKKKGKEAGILGWGVKPFRGEAALKAIQRIVVK
ncbi:MAG: response regulator [Proteobacteria bacterium]|nr:response regulator [Pseudomonadota bacterium]